HAGSPARDHDVQSNASAAAYFRPPATSSVERCRRRTAVNSLLTRRRLGRLLLRHLRGRHLDARQRQCRLLLSGRLCTLLLDERSQQVDRQREQRRRVVLRRDLRDRLEIAELDRSGIELEYTRSFRQLLRRLKLALGVDHLRATLTLGLRLPRHRTLHLLWQ